MGKIMNSLVERGFRVGARIVTQGQLRSPKHSNHPIVMTLHRLFNRRRALVVQIGAYDGKSNDFLSYLLLNNSKWQAILVEPVPFLFERLKSTYLSAPWVNFSNVAIGIESKSMTFYYVAPAAEKDFPDWCTQLGSFSKEHILKHLDSIEPFIHSVEVKCETLMDFLSRCGAINLDVLMVDAEGFDYDIVYQVDFGRTKPRIIVYEHTHLSQQQRTELIGKLQSGGYRVTQYDEDTLAVRARFPRFRTNRNCT
jgi:FkbM family methyltransferase